MSIVVRGSTPSRSEPPRIADHGGSTIAAAHDATPNSTAYTTPASAPRRAASGRPFTARPAVRPPINDARAGLARNSKYQAGNAAVVDGAPTSAANPAPMFPFVRIPDRVSRATVVAPTSRVVGTPIDVARIIVDWFGSRSACCTSRAAPLPRERPTNRA